MAIVNGLCTLAQARASLNLKSTDIANDADIEDYISATTPLIEAVTGPMFARSMTFLLNGGEAFLMLPVRFNAVTAITDTGVAVTGYTAIGTAGLIALSSGFSAGTQNVSVTVTVGVSPVPANVVLAARECVRELWQIGRQGNRPSFGNEVADAQSAASGYVMSNRVRALLFPNPDVPGFA